MSANPSLRGAQRRSQRVSWIATPGYAGLAMTEEGSRAGLAMTEKVGSSGLARTAHSRASQSKIENRKSKLS